MSGGGGNGLALFAGSQDAAHDLDTLTKHKVTSRQGGPGMVIFELEMLRCPRVTSSY